jgi:hypothetical protein
MNVPLSTFGYRNERRVLPSNAESLSCVTEGYTVRDRESHGA